MKKFFLIAAASAAVFSACTKGKNCAEKLMLEVSNPSPSVGSSVTITSSRESEEDVFQWNGPHTNLTNQSNILTIDDLKPSHRGWYYVNKGNTDCNNSLNDSFYLDVKLLQETAPCSPVNNTVSCSNIPDLAASSVTKSFSDTWKGITMEASGSFGYPSFRVIFSSNNGNKEPEDGVYTTQNTLLFDPIEERDLVSVSFLYSNNFYHCQEGSKVYVKHVNGKLQVSFCSLVFGSSPLPNTTCSGRLTEL